MNLGLLAVKISEMSAKGATALYAEMAKLGEEMAASIRSSLDAGVPGPQSRTGTLAASIGSRTTAVPDAVVTEVGSFGGPKYAAYLELGTGPGRIYPRTAQYLYFEIGGRKIFAKSVAPVRAYYYVARSLDEVRPVLVQRLTAAIYGA